MATILVLGATCLGAVAQAERLVSIYPLQSEQLDRKTRRQLETVLRQESERLPGVTVQSRGKTQRARTRASSEMRHCHLRRPCLVEVGELSGATILVFGNASRTEHSFDLELGLVDIDKERILRKVSAEVKGDAAEIEERIRELSAQLISPDEFVGSLDIRALMPGARVIVDGMQVGTTPGGPFTGIQPGLRELQIQLQGTNEIKQMVRIRHGGVTVVNVRVDGEQLRADVDEPGSLRRPPHAAAVALARQLRRAEEPPSVAPTIAMEQAEAPSVAAAPERGAETLPAEDDPLPDLLVSGIAVSAAGAATSLFGVVGVGAWAFANNQLSSAMTSDGEGVRDRALYNEWDQQRGFYEALGLAGGITLPLGLLALAGGAGLTWWSLTGSSAGAAEPPEQTP